MSFDITKLATDRIKERDGVWVDCPGGLRLLIARMNNSRFQRYLAGRRREAQRDARFTGGSLEEQIDDDTLQEMTIAAVAQYVLLGWENLTEGSETIGHSIENAITLLTKYPEFFRLVEDFSLDIELFRCSEDKSAEGNSVPTSDTPLSGENTNTSSEAENTEVSPPPA